MYNIVQLYEMFKENPLFSIVCRIENLFDKMDKLFIRDIGLEFNPTYQFNFYN